jgi:hypothetical protein
MSLSGSIFEVALPGYRLRDRVRLPFGMLVE